MARNLEIKPGTPGGATPPHCESFEDGPATARWDFRVIDFHVIGHGPQKGTAERDQLLQHVCPHGLDRDGDLCAEARKRAGAVDVKPHMGDSGDSRGRLRNEKNAI